MQAFWLGTYLGQTEQVKKYYKYNLSFMSIYIAMEFVRDPFLKAQLDRSLLMTEKVIHNHQNLNFDALRIAVNTSYNQDALVGSVTESLYEYSLLPHHKFSLGADMSDIKFVDYNGEGKQIPKHPFPISKRDFSGHFQWERNPFTPLASATTDHGKFEGISGIA